MAEWYCEHFDCACPPFVLDGRVGQREWADYVQAMDITSEEIATAKVRLVAGPSDEDDMTVSRHIADVLREEAENAEAHGDADIQYSRHRKPPTDR